MVAEMNYVFLPLAALEAPGFAKATTRQAEDMEERDIFP